MAPPRSTPAGEQVVFAPTIEGLFVRGLAGKLSPELVEQLKGDGLDVSRELLPAYPREVVRKAMSRVARALYPDKPESEGWYLLGKHVAPGYGQTLLGRAAAALAQLVGPRRTLVRLAHTLRNTNNYMEFTLRELGPTDFELDLHQSNEQPSYFQAILEDIIAGAGARGLRVAVAAHDPARQLATYRLTWG